MVSFLYNVYIKLRSKIKFLERKDLRSFLPIINSSFQSFGYLRHPESSSEGLAMMKSLKEGAPWLSYCSLLGIVYGLMRSGDNKPTHYQIPKGQILYKAVADGETISDYDPYFVEEEVYTHIVNEGINIEEALALTHSHLAKSFELYQTESLVENADVFISRAALISNKIIERKGGYDQAILTNRNQWSKPVLVAQIKKK